MAEDMIERAARATFLVGRDWDDPASFDAAPDYGKDVYRDYARAALLAALDMTPGELGEIADEAIEDASSASGEPLLRDDIDGCAPAASARIIMQNVIDRFRMKLAQGVPSSQEQVREKD